MKILYALTFAAVLFLGTSAALHSQTASPEGASSETEGSDLERVNDDVRFENAMQLYKIKNQKGKALALFGEYLELFPEGIHRKEVIRCIGDIYLERFDYKRAIKYYQQLYEEYGSEEEGISGFFQTGICYSRMGNTDKSAEVFKRIIELYPSSSYSAKARTQLDIEEMIK